VALDDVLFDRSILDDLGCDAAFEHSAPDLHQLARMRVGRKPKHHRNATIAGEPADEDAAAAAARAVIADIVEDHRRSGASAGREPRDGPELDIPIDLGIDLLNFAGRAECLHPAAQVAEGNGFSFTDHGLFRMKRAMVSCALGLASVKKFAELP